MKNILLVDDEIPALNSMESILLYEGYQNIFKCNDSRKVDEILNKNKIDMILLDLSMPYISGEILLKTIRAAHPNIQIIITTAINEAEVAVYCMKSGAIDYLIKPITPERLLASIKNISEIILLKNEVSSLKQEPNVSNIQNNYAFKEIITNHKSMLKIFQYMNAIAPSNHPVLIYGETGTGKELIAKALHKLSERKGDFIAINIAGLDENMFSDTLFGHVKGAFTGADKAKLGLVESANFGTLFLDEIGDIPPTAQVKLLRLLQEKEFLPIGSETIKISNCTIIAATNLKLNELQDKNQFRRDLFYRLNDHFISLPPLRERKEDIPLLINHFLKEFENNKINSFNDLPINAKASLLTHNYPGNIRELQKIIFEFIKISKGGPQNFEEVLKRFHIKNEERFIVEDIKYPTILPTLKQLHDHLIKEALIRANGNQSVAAKWLGVTPQALSQTKKRNKKENL